MKFEGIMPALITPMTPDESVNTEALGQLIEYLLEKGADGFYIGGATGEGLVMGLEERKILAREAIRSVKGRKPCIVHVASINFHEAVELAKHAESCGADAISAVPPLFYKYDEQDVYNYYKKLAETVHIPMMIYYNQAAGFTMTGKFVARMFEVDNITSIKWTSTNYYEMMLAKELTNGELNIINGPDDTLYLGLAAGADGGIGTTYNMLLPYMKTIYERVKQNDMVKAKEAQEQANAVMTILRRHGYTIIPALKVILSSIGISAGNARFPAKEYNDSQKEEIISLVKQTGLQL